QAALSYSNRAATQSLRSHSTSNMDNSASWRTPLVGQAGQSGAVAGVDGDGAGTVGCHITDEHQRGGQARGEIHSHTRELDREMDVGLIRTR
ncbi:hypothetical protein ACFWPK_34565, partial [Nocardia sp. NPDC058519]|uniref:hypothetical protein n=1 Tax=Nocardia sp. NPDC058519 TaxID=3346535 RepID=UPI00364EFF45